MKNRMHMKVLRGIGKYGIGWCHQDKSMSSDKKLYGRVVRRRLNNMVVDSA